MRILFLTQVLPYPLDAGPKVRAYYTLRYLAQHHGVTLLSFVRPGDRPEAVEHLRTICGTVHTVPMHRSRVRDAWYLLRSLVRGEPFLIARDWVPAMAEAVRALVEPPIRSNGRRRRASQPEPRAFDAVHADQLWMAPYALLARRRLAGGRRPTVILDQHNAVFQIPRRLAKHATNPLRRALLALEARKLARYELRACQQFDHVSWVTHEDRTAVLSEAPTELPRLADGQHSSVIPICVQPDERSVIWRQPGARRVTFLGGLHWPPNGEGALWLARDVWPRVRRRVPDAVLTIIGKSPPPALTAIGERRADIEITGYVADPTPYLAETAAFVVPLHAGGGMRVKILDAWSWGLPVVTTRVGAEGLRAQDGENALVADAPEAFAQAVARVLTDDGVATRLAIGGRSTVEAYYDWRLEYRAWDRVYEGPRDAGVPPVLGPVLGSDRGTPEAMDGSLRGSQAAQSR
jgi:glycosyltransferase involved in cell wall biosynthesis